jgi:peptide/nickel transport system substrate-binding protein
MAIDRKTLNRVVFGGLNVPGCTPLSPATGSWFDRTIQCTPYDPAEARKLVQQSGIPNPTVQMTYPSSVQYQVLAEFLQSEEAAVGINVQLDPQDATTVGARENAGNYQTYLATRVPVKADPDWLRTGWPGVVSGFSDPRWNLDMNNGRLALSVAARQTIYHAALEVLLSVRPMIYLNYILNRAAFSNKLTGIQIYPDSQLRVEFAAYKAGT